MPGPFRRLATLAAALGLFLMLERMYRRRQRHGARPVRPHDEYRLTNL